MEILVNAATPFQLLAGQVVGIGAACMTQMTCLVVVGIGALLLQTPLKVLSYIPFWTPTLMLVRLALGTVAWWEVVVTIALLLVAILACTWFAACLYRYGVLMYGQRPGSTAETGTDELTEGSGGDISQVGAGRASVTKKTTSRIT